MSYRAAKSITDRGLRMGQQFKGHANMTFSHGKRDFGFLNSISVSGYSDPFLVTKTVIYKPGRNRNRRVFNMLKRWWNKRGIKQLCGR